MFSHYNLRLVCCLSHLSFRFFAPSILLDLMLSLQDLRQRAKLILSVLEMPLPSFSEPILMVCGRQAIESTETL
jgi:hypothetical protein